jgi:release factor glutamine methyltransferase
LDGGRDRSSAQERIVADVEDVDRLGPRQIVAEMTAALAVHYAHPEAEARQLLEAVVGAQVDPNSDQLLAAADLARCRVLLQRRLRGEPLAYVTGRVRFRARTFLVDRRVLVPRPATEALIEIALEAVRAAGWPAPRVADICTGSGVVALTLAAEVPSARVVAVDLSDNALAVAATNLARLAPFGIGDRVTLRAGDLLGPLGDEHFEMIVSNPPYIPSPKMATLAPEVLREPHLALDGGDDGLVLIRRLVTGARAHLVPGGLLAIEHDVDQHPAVAALMHAAGFVAVQGTRDLGQILRVTSGRAG